LVFLSFAPVIKDVFNIELLIANNFVQDEFGSNSHHELATGLTGVFQLTKQLELFAEWDAFYPTAGVSAVPRHYPVAGTVYFVIPNCNWICGPAWGSTITPMAS
jgi:hypothetical protein